jgi:hypothetical protein
MNPEIIGLTLVMLLIPGFIIIVIIRSILNYYQALNGLDETDSNETADRDSDHLESRK